MQVSPPVKNTVLTPAERTLQELQCQVHREPAGACVVCTLVKELDARECGDLTPAPEIVGAPNGMERLTHAEIKERYPIRNVVTLADAYLLPLKVESGNVAFISCTRGVLGFAKGVSMPRPLRLNQELVLTESWAEIQGFYNPGPGFVVPVWGRPKRSRVWGVKVCGFLDPWTIAGASYYQAVDLVIVKEL